MTESPLEIFGRAVAARTERRMRDAADLFEAALAHPEGGLTAAHRHAGYVQWLKTLTRLGAWTEVESASRRALGEFPDETYVHQCLGEALTHHGRRREAEAALRRALELEPEQDGARALLAALAVTGPEDAPASRPPRPWPTRSRFFDEPKDLVRKYLLKHRPRPRFIGPGARFLTLGSCFAQNLARGLKAAGYAAHFEDIGEEVNSTYANRYLLDWIENGPVDANTRAMELSFGAASRERLSRAFESCDVFVMTLGVAAAFFDPGGRFIFVSQHTSTTAGMLTQLTMRTASVAENADNIRRIVEAVRRLAGPQVRIVLTVSPVPMAGTNEFDSAITADCLSKSTLRLACQDVLSGNGGEDLIYWPSFEIVRWLGPHFGPDVPRVYGEEDGNSRHVSGWLVDLIVGLFLEFYGPETAWRPADDAGDGGA